MFSLYLEALEGGGSFRKWTRKVTPYVTRGEAADPERSAAEAGRRAKARLRRYCVANKLNRLGTLTYSGDGCFDPAQVRQDLAEFFRLLRTATGGKPLPYVWVPEWHKSHGLHAHFAVGRYIKRRVIEEAWGRGFIHIKILGDLPTGSTTVSEARRAAGYLSKYVSKTFDAVGDRSLGSHRYDVAQGFTPDSVTLTGTTAASVIAQASEVLSMEPTWEWSSREVEGWEGPPAISIRWGR